MANALVLTASSSGRTALPGDAGFALEISDDEPVVVDAWPYPAGWEPDDVRLYREGRELQLPPAEDECRWILTGEERFGEFTALAFAAGRPVTSPALVIRPAPAPAPPAAAPPAGAPPALAPSAGAPPAGTPPAATPAPQPQPTHVLAPVPAAQPPAARVAAAEPSEAPSASAAPAVPAAPEPPSAPATPPRPATAAGPATPAHASAEDLRALAELPTPEFDGRFAAVVGALFALLSAAVLALVVARLMIPIDVPPPVTDPPPAVSRDGTIADRVGLASATLLIGVGAVLLLAGAALAALEVRGRQRRTSQPTRWQSTERGLRVLPALLDRLGQVRATVAVLVTGGCMVGIGVVAQLAWSAGF